MSISPSVLSTSIGWILCVISDPWHGFNLLVDEIVNVGFNLWLGNISLLTKAESSSWIGPSIWWISFKSSSSLPWKSVLVCIDESPNFFIDVFITNISSVSLSKSSGWIGPSICWISFKSSSYLPWEGILISVNKTPDFLIDTFVTNVLSLSECSY